MRQQERPADYPQLTDYTPSRFMLPTSHYDEAKADRAVKFIEMLPHTKGEWEGQRFFLLPWQSRIIKDVFGIVKDDGMRQFRTVYIEIPKKQGKQLSLDTLIPTPSGFSKMRDIEVGDVVFDECGQKCHVIAKSDVDTEETAYRMIWRDGSEIIAGARHQWCVEYIYGKTVAKVMTSEEIYEKQRSIREYYGDNLEGLRSCIRIHVSEPLQTKEANLPVDPYTFGFWLGDGTSNKPYLTIFNDDVTEVLASIPYSHTTFYPNGEGKSMCYRFEELKHILVENHRQKSIPQEYLRASERQRWELLAGLIDSDGSVSNVKGQTIYTSSNKQLTKDVRELLWSLGIKNAITEEPSIFHGDLTGETIYTIRFVSFDDMPVSKLTRYLVRRRQRTKETRNSYHYLKSIEPIGNGIPMQCIQVDSPSHCYLAGSSMIPTHNSELAAAITLYLLFADHEPAAEVFSAAADRQQAGIVYEVAKRMVEMTPALLKRSKIMAATKRIVNYANAGYYQVVSADVANKHGYSISGLCFDEIHNQPNRKLWDVLTKGSGDARRQALHVAITTAGTDRNSICYELHCKAQDILAGRKIDPTFYPVVYSLPDDADWSDEKSWYKVNPSLGYTVPIERMREAFLQAQENPAEENVFRQLRLCQWVGSSVAWIPEHVYNKGNVPINADSLIGRDCYCGLDLSSTSDITAFCMVFPPMYNGDNYIVLPHFWLPRETLELRVRRDRVPYDIWERQGLFHVTEGNVVDYNFVRKTINELNTKYHIVEIGVDRWNATQLITDLDGDGFTMIPIGMGFKDMSPGMKELYKLLLEGKMLHGGNPVLQWMSQNVVAETDAADNIKPSKKKSTEKIDGIVAWIMGLDRAIRHEVHGSVYDERGLLSI